MNRRGFLGALIGAATLDPERLLWVPGKRLISIPKPSLPIPPHFLDPPFLTMTQFFDKYMREIVERQFRGLAENIDADASASFGLGPTRADLIFNAELSMSHLRSGGNCRVT